MNRQLASKKEIFKTFKIKEKTLNMLEVRNSLPPLEGITANKNHIEKLKKKKVKSGKIRKSERIAKINKTLPSF